MTNDEREARARLARARSKRERQIALAQLERAQGSLVKTRQTRRVEEGRDWPWGKRY